MVGVSLMYRTGYFHQRIDVSGRAAFQEDNDTALASQLVGGCDWWVNLPRPPLEASGTSGMKSVLGGGLQLSVLDGWWREAYDGSNGWAIDGRVDPTTKRRTCATPTRYPNCSSGRWCRCSTNAMPKASRNAAVVMMRRGLVTNGPRFSATRMLCEYADRICSYG
jgi:starch phosphorylase